MKTYLVDTNIFLRFLLNDVKEQTKQARLYFQQAKANKILLTLHPVTVFEVDYALVKLYSLSKQTVVEKLQSILSISYIHVIDRAILLAALKLYNQKTIDFVDVFLYTYAESIGSEVLSFDKDFKKMG